MGGTDNDSTAAVATADAETDTPTPSYNPTDMDGDTGEDGPFEVCPECGRPAVILANHTCRDSDSATKPTADERAARAAADDRDRDRAVFLPPGHGARAYHEIEGEADIETDPDAIEVVCSRTTATAAGKVRPQHAASDRGYYPCGTCRRVQKAQDTKSST